MKAIKRSEFVKIDHAWKFTMGRVGPIVRNDPRVYEQEKNKKILLAPENDWWKSLASQPAVLTIMQIFAPGPPAIFFEEWNLLNAPRSSGLASGTYNFLFYAPLVDAYTLYGEKVWSGILQPEDDELLLRFWFDHVFIIRERRTIQIIEDDG